MLLLLQLLLVDRMHAQLLHRKCSIAQLLVDKKHAQPPGDRKCSIAQLLRGGNA
jgi:hypothetical protein